VALKEDSPGLYTRLKEEERAQQEYDPVLSTHGLTKDVLRRNSVEGVAGAGAEGEGSRFRGKMAEGVGGGGGEGGTGGSGDTRLKGEERANEGYDPVVKTKSGEGGGVEGGGWDGHARALLSRKVFTLNPEP